MLLILFPLAAQERTVGVIFSTEASFEGYTLFAPSNATTTYLIDNDGNVIQRWESDYQPNISVYLLENGHLLRTSAYCELRQHIDMTCTDQRIQEFTWDGELVWEFVYATDDHQLHHDIELLPNGNILMIAAERKTVEEAIASGRDPELLGEEDIWIDIIIEVEPVGADGGRIVWEWHTWDHLIQDFDPTKANYGVVSEHPERIDVNYMPVGGWWVQAMADWTHINGIDYNAELDQIMLTVQRYGEIWVIDHGEDEAVGAGGGLLYRWGNPQTYRAGDRADQQLFAPHDGHWIDRGLPGAGHILIFNNGLGRPSAAYSSVEEIVPPLGEDGRYDLPEETGPYGPSDSFWRYTAPEPSDMLSPILSGAQRLPNGNTLIAVGVAGRVLEVTPTGELVWEYVNPVTDREILHQGEEAMFDNAIFRATRYGADYPGLVDRDLTPEATIESHVYEARVSLTPALPAVGETFVIEGQLECLNGDCHGFSLVIDYLPDILRVDRIGVGSILGEAVIIQAQEIDVDEGVVRLVVSGMESPASEIQTIFVLQITALAADVTWLDLIELEVYDEAGERLESIGQGRLLVITDETGEGTEGACDRWAYIRDCCWEDPSSPDSPGIWYGLYYDSCTGEWDLRPLSEPPTEACNGTSAPSCPVGP